MIPVADLLGSKLHHLLQIILLIYLTGQLYLLILTVRLHRPQKFWIVMTAFFSLGWFILAMLSDISYRFGKETFFMVRAFEGLPWGFYLVYEILMMGYLFAAFLNCHRFIYTHLTDSSIKETIDLLPAGILISLPDGTVEMSNVQMNDLCEELTNRPLTNANQFWKTIKASGESGQSHVLIRSEEDDDALLFSRSPIMIEKQEYVQILATDVTERYQAIEEVQEKNRQLREYQNRMKSYQQLAAQTIRSEEILNARRIVHDQEGHALLTARYYLEHPELKPATLLDQAILDLNPFAETPKRFCGVGPLMKSYDNDGKCYPCHAFAPLCIGKEKAERARQMDFSCPLQKAELDEKCRECPISGNCPTCYGINFHLYDNVYHVAEDHCRMMKVLFLANAMFKYRQYKAGMLSLSKDDELKLLRNIKACQKLAD